ncbi:hypothetical protein LTA6_001521 [Microbacterium sp. LTA6]|uniref:hypothetical protein n=1 Tax=Microbacterium sp. LTA6 TaxID=3129771 RepID=UPI00324DB7AA
MRMLRSDSARVGDSGVADDELVIATTRDELAALAGAINEALEAVEEWEFDTRLGITPDQARRLAARISDVLRDAFRPE